MPVPPPTLKSKLFAPGQRVGIAVSGGADSVALLRRVLEMRCRVGMVLSVAHVHHGIRGEEADADAMFVERLAAEHGLPFHLDRVDAPAAASACGETLEEAARNLRYAFFRKLIADGAVDVVATAHTLDDQAETVLHKLLRGAWTEGLSGILSILPAGRGRILRPFLQANHAEIREWLRSIGQAWREDASNLDPAYTRNRIRHQLLPSLVGFNPQVAGQLAHLATIAADEEDYWQREVARLLPSLLLPGKPVRGGGRSNSTHPEEAALGVELARLRQLHPAAGRRVLRALARQLGARLSFDHTERLWALAGPQERPGRSAFELPGGIVAERTLRELRLRRTAPGVAAPSPAAERGFLIPGEISSAAYGVRLRAEPLPGAAALASSAILRPWKPADRVLLCHSRGPKRVKDVLDRLHVTGIERANWPVIESGGKIVWMRGVEVDSNECVFTEMTDPKQAGIE